MSSVAGTSLYSGYPLRLSRRNSLASSFYYPAPSLEKIYEFVRPSTTGESTLVTPKRRVSTLVTPKRRVSLLLLHLSDGPYWLQSYTYTYSDFQNMGLWEFCFDGFRYPKYQYDHKFMGCNYIFSEEYRIIWSWMLPAWFMAVQTFMTIGLLASMTTLVTVSLILMRWPMQMIMRYEWHLTGFCFLCQAVSVVAIFFAVLVFGVMCWTRDWLLNPNFNYLSWSYAFAVVAGGFHAFSGFVLLHSNPMGGASVVMAVVIEMKRMFGLSKASSGVVSVHEEHWSPHIHVTHITIKPHHNINFTLLSVHYKFSLLKL
ncbi:hypothetical protein GWK47_025021 [Chionoecetes opilio]|uniref:Uncharacterized protein n=1 Tax=Chionoecetes opilio TaxID=41210 RepID=A0A8J5CFD7_CHIOP|nr:hypothetical protein GWK47_025021 [Chionoecetes opilio]